MPAAFLSAGLNYLGAQEQASATEYAANTRAAAERESARLAAEAAKFRPVGITTRYGTSNFQMSPEGYLTGAGYNLAPELRGYQDRLMGLTERGLGQAEAGEAMLRPTVGAAQSLFNLGSRYLEQTPEQTAQKYIESQYNLLAPSRERSLAGLRNDQFQKGRLGLSVGATGERPSGGLGLSATNPEMEAYYNSLAQQDLQLAQQAEEAGQQRTAFGAGLFGTGSDIYNLYSSGQVNALSPFSTYLGAGQTIEELGQAPLKLGAALGGQAAAYGGNVGQSLLQGGLAAARTQQGGQGFSPTAGLYAGLANSPRLQTGFENLFSGYGQPVQTGYTGSPTMQPYENEQLANSFQYGDSSGYYQPKRSF
jgi:hypothetical protein